MNASALLDYCIQYSISPPILFFVQFPFLSKAISSMCYQEYKLGAGETLSHLLHFNATQCFISATKSKCIRRDLIKSLFNKYITRILTNMLSLCGILKILPVFPQLCFHLISFNIILPLDRYLILIISYRTLSNNVMIWEGISTSMWRRLETL